ncbi:MAG: hypothetical protein M5U27_04585 [Gaiella sp.]|nr:hypothetical protein [Gaiella sp.]
MPAARSPLVPLAWIEAKRFARHPLFLTGFVLALVFSGGEYGPAELDHQFVPAFFVGLFGLVVAARLTASTRRSEAVVDAAPVSETTRTAALCAACLVPAAAALIVVVFFRLVLAIFYDPRPAYSYGVFTTGERYVILLVLPVIACLGAPLLGVAVGRWLRFPGAPLLVAVALFVWGMLAGYRPSQMGASTWPARILHMLTPYTAWIEHNGSGDLWVPTVVRSLTGSPAWFAVWTLALCALAACAALLHGAEGRVRRAVVRASCVAGAVAVTSLTLAVVTGYSVTHDSSSEGTVVSDSRTPLPPHP